MKLWSQFPLETVFAKCSIADVWQGSEHAWVSEYVSHSEYASVLNILQFWVCPGSEYSWIYLTDSWICLIMARYATIFVNMPKSAWMTFVLPFPIVTPCLLESVITYFDVYAKAVFLKRQNLIFSLVASTFDLFHDLN